MSPELRIILIIGAILALVYFFWQIRKNRLQIDFAIFWSLFACFLLFMGIFPRVVTWVANLLGFESTSNFVYLVVIFILIIKLFTNTIKLSKMHQQINDLSSHIALKETKADQRTSEKASPD